MPWRNRPFLRILFCFASGILAARVVHIPNVAFGHILTLYVTMTSGAVITAFLHLPFRYRRLQSILLFLSLFVTGWVFTIVAEENSNHPFPEKETFWKGEIVTEPVQRPGNVRFIVRLTGDTGTNIKRYPPVKIMARLKSDTLPQNLHLGHLIVFESKITPVPPPLNPGEFNYRQFLKDKGIRYQTYLTPNRYLLIPESGGHTLSELFGQWRNRLLNTLKAEKLTKEEYSVAAAILLGYDQLIAPGLQQDFTAAGAVHILCVSGMHVGIIYLIFSLLFAFLLRFKKGKQVRGLLLLFVLWAYALLTGMSPSVSRAATMLSLFIIAEILDREYDHFNLLAASAFLLLAFHPLLLFDVGFQLSYAAVTGILLFYYPIYRSLYLPGKFLRLLWAAISVSLAAQMGAFAIAAHYFHMFPRYFLLTNLAVFGLAYVIIFSGLAYLTLSWIPMAGYLFAIILAHSTGWLIAIVHFMASLPHAAVYDLYFPWTKVFLIFAFLLSVYYGFVQKSIHAVLPTLISLVLLLGIHIQRQFALLHQHKMIVYALHRHTAIDLIKGKQHLLLTDTAAWKHPELLAYSVKNNRIALGLNNDLHPLTQPFKSTLFYYRSGFGETEGCKFYVTRPGQKYYPRLKQKIKVNLLICHPPWKTTLKEISKSIAFQRVLLEGALPQWAERQIKTKAKQLNINFIDLKKQRAFVLDLRGE